MESMTPTGRYDPNGDLYLDIPSELLELPLFPIFRLELTRNIQPEHTNWEPGGGTLWCSWRWAKTVEQRARALWPDMVITAAANPVYGLSVPLAEVRA